MRNFKQIHSRSDNKLDTILDTVSEYYTLVVLAGFIFVLLWAIGASIHVVMSVNSNDCTVYNNTPMRDVPLRCHPLNQKESERK